MRSLLASENYVNLLGAKYLECLASHQWSMRLGNTKMIINAGIKEVVYETEYHFTEQSRELFATAGVLYRKLEPR